MTKQYFEIDITEGEKGSAFGYVVNTEAENIKNWLEEKGYSQESLNRIRLNYDNVAILKSIYVEKDYRGEGIGTQLLEDFMDEAFNVHYADAIVLEADTGENNEFSLVEWYEENLFQIIERDKDNYPLMIYVR